MQKHIALALPERESIMNNSTATMNHAFLRSEGSTQVLPPSTLHYDRLVDDSRSVPLLLNTSGGPPDIIPSAFSIENPLGYGAPNVQSNRGVLLPNVQSTNEEEEIVYSSLSVMENYAYNKRQELSSTGLGHSRSKNHPSQSMNNDRVFFTQRQRSVHHYDYPTVKKEAGDTDSMGYQSVNNMTKD